MLPTGETISPRSKFPDQSLSINQKPGVRSAALLECIPEWHLIHKGFFSLSLTLSLRMLTPSRTQSAVRLCPNWTRATFTRTRAREGLFTVVFYGPENSLCKTTKFHATPRNIKMAEMPSVRNSAQADENNAKTLC